ncbi:hypothetical protein [Streptomyces sp. Ag109_O5-10]|uniref:hypothetical protein n=1 Tax=Streptomyces sp. Ag109_O5-10 TaxID=1855349 RepID=UPI00089C127D|nr:hypothetical protein [Streptomyces sp. Ag109_O5-10]SEF02039.1 hypothetical protein SAMN05216533_5239 [Streptomyces sp. Ag109_O5-10]
MHRTDEFDFGLTWLMSQFHEDWSHNGPTARAAAEYHLWDELAPGAVLAVRHDARLLLRLPSTTIEALWLAGTATRPAFFSGGPTGVTSGAQWMETLIALCDAWLARNTADGVGPPDVPGTTGGEELADAVLAEIAAARFVPDEVRRDLAECLRHCTPDLAFRLLLRAMAESGTGHGAAVSPEHYARLEELGSALHYGEYVVDAVKFMVDQG